MLNRLSLSLLSLILGWGMSASAADLSPGMERVFATAADSEMIPAVIFLENRLTMDEVYPDARALPMDERREFVVTVLKARFAQMSPKVMEQLEFAREDGKTTLLRPLWILNAIRTTTELSVLRELQGYPEVLYLAYDPPMENTLDDDGWGVIDIGALQVQDELGVAGDGVLVGHKDSGVNYELSAFDGRIWINSGEDIDNNGVIDGTDENGIDDDHNGYIDDFRGWNFDWDTNDVIDDNGHGTKTASIISSNVDHCDRIAVAPEAKLMILLGYRCQAAVWESSQYAIEMGAQVVSASVSFKQTSCANSICPNRVAHRWVSEMELAAGIIHANSTGNTGSTIDLPLAAAAPSDCPPPAMTDSHLQQGGVSSVVGVAAYYYPSNYYTGSGHGPSGWSRIDQCEHPCSPFCGAVGSESEYPAEFEDYPYHEGTLPGLLKPDVTAPSSGGPGGTANSLNRFDNCDIINATSGATPHVGGTLALIYSAFPGITPEEAYLMLVNGTLDQGDPGADNQWGFGKLRVNDAIQPILSTAGKVSGTISSSGSPLVGVRVSVGDRQPVFTDENGSYTVSADPGNYPIEFYRFGYQSISSTVNITAGQTITRDEELLPATAASLEITLDNQEIPWGPGVENISIGLPAGNLYGLTNGEGVVSFPAVFSGVHRVIIGRDQDFYQLINTDVELNAGTNSITVPLTASDYAFPTGSPQNDGYVAYDDNDMYGPQFDWIELNPDLGGSGERLDYSIGSHDACITRSLPFSFNFYGQSYSSIQISPNGYIAFGNGCLGTWEWFPIPQSDLPNAYCAVWAADYWPELETGGDVYYFADSDRAIVEWYDVLLNQQYYQWGRAAFQIILEPAGSDDGRILFQYNDIEGYIEGTTGLENHSGTVGLQYGHDYQYAPGAAPIRAGRAIRFVPDFLDAVDVPVLQPLSFELGVPYPNPFNSETTIPYTLGGRTDIQLRIYDLLGREVELIHSGLMAAGSHHVKFNAQHCPSGIYFIELTASDIRLLQKVALIK